MDAKTFSLVAGIIFAVVGLFHLVRIFEEWPVIIGDRSVPMSVSRPHRRPHPRFRAGLRTRAAYLQRATIRTIWLSANLMVCVRPGCRKNERLARSQATSSLSNALASFRSSVLKPSVNQL